MVSFPHCRRNAPLTMLAIAALCASSLAGDENDKAEEARRARQLDKMKRSAANYSLSTAGEAARALKFIDTPALRWTNPIAGARDGTVFLWIDRGRPQAILQLFTYDEDHFTHEWQSLSEGPLSAEREGQATWSPEEPGARFRELPGAGPPAGPPAARLRQMQALAEKFSATFTGFAQSPTPVELRLLTQPLWRYEQDVDPERIDGAQFALAQGTDPQALVLLEARVSAAQRRWHYAVARMASGSITARYGEQEVFSVPKYDFKRDPRKSFFALPQQPVPGNIALGRKHSE